jgi:hypothetical protein
MIAIQNREDHGCDSTARREPMVRVGWAEALNPGSDRQTA